MYKKGFISVIVPVYNVERYLRQCLDSIINQTYRNLDIILIDDGSTDKSGAICDEYVEKDSRIRVIHKTNGGLSSARNSGLELIENEGGGGEFITYVDSDDFLELDIYEKCINKFNNNLDIDIVIFGFINEYKDSMIKDGKIYADLNKIDVYNAILLYESSEIVPSVWSKIFRYEKVKKLRFPYGKVYEDVVYSYLAIYNSSNISTISDIGYYYRIDNIDSISYKIKSNVLDLYADLEDLRQYFVDNNKIEYVASVNTLLINHLRIYRNDIEKLPIYREYLDIIKRTRKYPIRVNSKSNYYIRYRLFSYLPRYSYMIENLVDKMYNLIVPKLKQIYKK